MGISAGSSRPYRDADRIQWSTFLIDATRVDKGVAALPVVVPHGQSSVIAGGNLDSVTFEGGPGKDGVRNRDLGSKGLLRLCEYASRRGAKRYRGQRDNEKHQASPPCPSHR